MIPAPGRIITITTDFGTRDGYAGAMKGVIRRTAPEACIEDLTHEIDAGNIQEAAWTLRTAVSFFPRGTVHVVVVDPGVGTSRHALLVLADGQFFIGPDNGVFSWIWKEAANKRAWRLTDDAWRIENPAPTFHGRDLFSHAAALLVQEGDVSIVAGEGVIPVIREHIAPDVSEDGRLGQVIHTDRFGNVVTNLRVPDPTRGESVSVWLPGQNQAIDGVRTTYGDVVTGECLALVGSHGFLEIAVREGSAAEQMGLSVGDTVELRIC